MALETQVAQTPQAPTQPAPDRMNVHGQPQVSDEAKFESWLSKTEGNQPEHPETVRKKRTKPQPVQEEPEAKEDQPEEKKTESAEDEERQEASESQDEGGEAEDADEGDEVESIKIDPDAEVFETTVKVEGGKDEVRKLSLKELQSGYMRSADYQRKTQELAKERATVGQKLQQEVQSATGKYEHNLTLLKQALVHTAMPEFKEVDWAKLSAEDPAEYVRLQQKYANFNQVLQAIEGEAQKAQHQSEAHRQASIKAAVEENVAVLKRDIPGWNNETYQKLLKTGIEEYGFTPEEVGNVYDARTIKLLHDAHRYRELMRAKPSVEKRVVTVPKVVKPGTAERPDARASRTQELRKALRKSGRVEDAAKLFENLL